jgi:murein DD-endopeptidase MepM/ murein hydrolase activator NlpD
MHWIPKAPERRGSGYGRKGRLWAAGWHTGVDYLCPVGTPVSYPFWVPGGKVLEVGRVSWGSAYGLAVIVQVRPGVRYMVAHLSEVSVKPGQRLKRGQRIGLTGNTGNSTGPHLHLEKRIGPSYRYALDARAPQESG